jgi:TP901 family phage tail tape measure protein
MANYQVTYQVNVLTENAIKSIEAFTAATKQLTNAAEPFRKVSRALNKLKTQMDGLSKKAPTIQIKTSQAEQRINRLLGKLRQLKKEANLVASVMPGAAPVGGGKAAGKAPRSTTATAAAPPPVTKPYASAYAATSPYRNAGRVRSIWPNRPKDIVYKTFGPTQLTANGGMAIDMLKGMGIAYGIAGIGALFNNILNDSVAYDNTMKTVENILKSHDKLDDFAGRFSLMQRTVRDVGLETKFKVTEVADAAKFLAMAGLDVDAIRNAIRPIADIALVGDTDLGQTADLVTNIMTAYNIVPEKMRNAADVMVNTFTMSNTTLTEIAEAYKYSASLLSAADVPFEHSAAAIGILGNAGIKGSQAGTTLRTIMGNIVNPTKKQQKAWDKAEVNPGKGNDRKDLIDVFNELAQKNLDISVFYQMFHKTAAAGAVALVKHVQEWNEIIAENFLSQGMAKRLADEKKNTIQGLWAQLTSVFQDNGVTAFSKVDGVIRNALRTGIEWLKSGEAKKAFDEAFKVFIQFGKIMADVTKWFKWLFDHFGGFIVMWAKFKLYIWPIVSAFNAMRVALHGLMFIKNISLAVRGLGMSMMTLKKQMSWFGTSAVFGSGGTAAAMSGGMMPLGVSWLPGVTHKQSVKAAKGLVNLNRPHGNDFPGFVAYKHDTKRYAKRIGWQQAKNFAKGPMASGIGGMAGIGFGMHELTREDGKWQDTAAGVFYSAAGMAAMAGGPAGWAAAVALAGLGAVGQVWASISRAIEAAERLAEATRLTWTANGILINSENKIQQALDGVYNRHDDINTLVANRIAMMKELLGLTPKEEAPANTTTSIYDKIMGNWEKVWGGSTVDAVLNAVPKGYGDVTEQAMAFTLKRPDGTITKGIDDGGLFDDDKREGLMRSMAATTELMTGGYYEKAIGSVNARINQLGLTRGVTQETFNTYFESLAKTYDPSQISGLIRWENATDMNEKWDSARILKDWDARRVVWQNMQEVLKPIQEAVNAYMTEYAAGKLTDSTLARYMTYTNMGNEVGTAMQNYSPANTGDWFRTFGYYNNAFHDMSVYNTQTKMYEFATAEEMAKITVGNMQRVTEAIKTMGLASDPAGIALTNNANLLLTTAQAFLETEGKLEDIAGKTDLVINGLHWQYDATDKMWYQLAEDGSFVMVQTTLQNFTDSVWGLGSTLGSFNWAQYWANMLPPALRPLVNNNKTLFNTPQTGALGAVSNTVRNAFGLPSNGKASKTKSSMTPQQMANAYAASQKNKTNDNGNPIVADDPGSKKKKKGHEGYKSRYGSNTAAPKQVIVNINNLLCVEKIDLSNPDNVEVINNLKEQLAQALIDVVHNFDDTWHG